MLLYAWTASRPPQGDSGGHKYHVSSEGSPWLSSACTQVGARLVSIVSWISGMKRCISREDTKLGGLLSDPIPKSCKGLESTAETSSRSSVSLSVSFKTSFMEFVKAEDSLGSLEDSPL